MIELFYYTSPNGRKAALALEETGLPYQVTWVDITAGEQHTDWFRQINPNAKIPAIVDHDGPDGRPLPVFESGAVLEYLAAKSGTLLPREPAQQWRARCWVYWQVANQGPMCGQAAHFVTHAAHQGLVEEYATERYRREAARCYQVLEDALVGQDYLAGEYSIADIACFPWTRVARGHGVDLADYPRVRDWSDTISARPAARRQPVDQRDDAAKQHRYSAEQWAVLFGTTPG